MLDTGVNEEMSKFIGEYPDNWPDIAERIKDKAGYKCERCHWPDESVTGHTLTVHHLDNNKSNIADWNLAALCQKCHLHIQGIVEMKQSFMFEHSQWMKPHVEGYLQSRGIK